MSDIPTLYQGEGILLAWGDTSSRGRTVTFRLEDSKDDSPAHPFKGIRDGKTGQRVGLVVVALKEDEHPAEQPKPEKVKQSWESMSYAQRSGILRNDPRFIEYLGVNTPEEAAAVIRRVCGVGSCAEIDGNDPAQAKFTILDMNYRYETGQQAEVRS